MVIGKHATANAADGSTFAALSSFYDHFLSLFHAYACYARRDGDHYMSKEHCKRQNFLHGCITCLGMSTKIVEEKRQLLLGCGIWMNANLYEGVRRIGDGWRTFDWWCWVFGFGVSDG